MRKVILFLFLFLFICFSIPMLFTTRKIELTSANVNETAEINKVKEKTVYDYKKYNTIKLLHADTKQIEEIPLDEYLYGVVSAEMPASFETEALKAQAVVARTYTIYKIVNNDQKHDKADICDDSSCCQAWISKEDRLNKWKEEEREEYWNKIVDAVDDTQGKIVTYEGKPINAFFHANSGGATEAPINVWGGAGYPYLQTVVTNGEDLYTQYHSELTISKEEFKKKIQKEHNDFKIDFSEKNCIKVEEYTEGNRVKTIKIGNLKLSGVEVRNIFKLRSANFKISIKEDNIKFEVVGYGHGVGMSQTGADSLAKEGKSYEEILHHYYTNVEIQNM